VSAAPSRSDFAAPHVPRSAIEYDRSTSSATAAAGPPLGLDDLEVLDGERTAGPPRPRRRAQDAFFTVRTTSSGCSSPNRHSRERRSARRRRRRRRRRARRGRWPSSLANTRRSAVAPEPAHRLGGELQPVGAALSGSPAAPARAPAAQRGEVVDAPPRPSAARAAPRRRRPARRRGSPGELVGQRLEVGELGRARSRRRSPSPARRRAPAPRGPTAGRAGRWRSCRPECAISLASPGPMAWAIRPASSSAARATGRPSSAPAAAARRASESISSSTFDAGSPGRTGRACP
jgi:hypothetical protein